MTRRRWWLVGVVTVAVVIRVALPEIIRRQAETRVSELLGAQVQIGDVDLGLLRGVVALEDVALRPLVPVPAQGVAPAAETPAAPEAVEPPVVGWRRFAVNLRWWPLVHRAVQFSSVELQEPRVALDRLADGALNLLAFVPVVAGEEAAEGTPGDAPEAPAEEKPWGVGVDHLVLRGGQIRFRDFALHEQGEPVDVRLPTIEVRDIALAPGLYGGPARTSVDVRVDEGRLRVNTRVWLRDGGVGLATTLRARRMPLQHVRLYVPTRGWRELGGELGASLVHRLETKKQNLVRGTVTLDDVTVRVPDVETPVLSWKHFGVAIDALDLEAHRAKIDRVELAGAVVSVHPRGGDLLPAIAGGPAPKAAGTANEDAPAAPAEPADAGAPWRWSVDTVRVSDTHLHVVTDEGTRDVGVALEMRELAGDGDHPAPTKLAVTLDAARVGLEGAARIAAPGFDGTLDVTDLPVPDVVGMAGALPPNVLQQGVLTAALRVAAGSAATPAGDATVAGSIGLAGFKLAGADPKLFSTAWDALDVAIDELRVPGVLGPAGAARAPIVVKLSKIELAKPRLQLTRTPEGLVLPPLSAAAPAGSAETAPSPPDPAPVAGAATDEPAPLEVTVASVRVSDGELRVSDRTVKPFFSGGFKPLALEVRGFRHPALAMEHLRLTATSLTRGRLEVTGRYSPAGGQFDVNGKDIALQPFNPYATHYSPYSIAAGALSVTTKATLGRGTYDSTTALTLDGFDLGSKEGASLFKEQFGISIEVALALLRDIQGRIAFDIPVEGDEQGAKVNVMTVAGQALRRAIVNAIASPLKLVGAAFGGGGEGAAPAPIVFAIGRAEPSEAGATTLDALAGLLASRPGIGITLEGAPTESDARWLHEQALYQELSEPQGVFGAIGNLTERGARERVRLALAARAEGEEGVLEPEDAAKLEEWLAERPKPGTKELGALVAARLAHVATTLREGHGVGPERVASAEPVTEVREGEPAVEFDLGSARPSGS